MFDKINLYPLGPIMTKVVLQSCVTHIVLVPLDILLSPPRTSAKCGQFHQVFFRRARLDQCYCICQLNFVLRYVYILMGL